MPNFIGQEHIIKELIAIIDAIQNGERFNILFRGASGYGKTTLAYKTILRCKKSYQLCIPIDGLIHLDLEKEIIFIDEIHTLKTPEELYPLLDSKQHTFIFASNESGVLKEPLQNRCINLFLTDYTEDEAKQIVDIYCPELEDIYKTKIADIANRNPRVIKSLCERLRTIFNYYGKSPDMNLFNKTIEETLNIKDGLSFECRAYLHFLKLAKVCSLDLISHAIKIDKATIQRDIEPVLIYKNLISISSRGRKIIE